MDKISDLKSIEEELSGCVKTDQHNWTKMYELMHRVETEELYKERDDTPSFTAWMNQISADLHFHISLLWTRLKAGRNYEEYAERAAKAGRTVTPLSLLSVPPESINLCATVAGKNAADMDRLIEKVVAGDLSRADLRAAARAKRASGESVPTSRHNRIDADIRTETDTDKITAADIVMALRRPDWLTVARDDKHFQHIYVPFTEFRAESGTATHTRRMDVLVAETITETGQDRLTLRGIEIKVSKSDLLSDDKMAEYTDFCDFFYIAIPDNNQDLLEAAHSVMLPTWGLLTISKGGQIRVETEPIRLSPFFRDKTLSNCIIKMA